MGKFCLCILLGSSIAIAQDGQIDSTFGTNGIVTYVLSDSLEAAHGIAMQTDGKILVSMSTKISGSYRTQVHRYSSGGVIDNSFGTNGIATLDTLVSPGTVLLQTDGKILLIASYFCLRIGSNGGIDTAYGESGFVTYPDGFIAGGEPSQTAALQSDGKLVVVGSITSPNPFDTQDFGVLRFNPNGDQDSTFGTNGLVTVDFGLFSDQANCVRIRNGKILVAGISSSAYLTSLCRLNSNGALDASFSNDGRRATLLNPPFVSFGLSLLSNGNFVIAGYVQTSSALGIARYDSAGNLDTGFGDRGSSLVNALSVGISNTETLTDNSMVVGLNLWSYSDPSIFRVIRINEDGLPDETFGTYGIATIPTGATSASYVNAIAVQDDGKLVIAGQSLSAASSKSRAVIARLTGTVSPVPIQLSNFWAFRNRMSVQLRWTTATEVDNYGFEIERRTAEDVSARKNWSKLGFVVGSGTSTSSKEYEFNDDSPSMGRNMYRLKQIDANGTYQFSGAVEIEILAPTEFEVFQNYPNPFNGTTTIHYQVPLQADVSMKIYDILGREVFQKTESSVSPGYYTFVWDSQTAPTGTYFYQVNAAGLSTTKKMLLLR